MASFQYGERVYVLPKAVPWDRAVRADWLAGKITVTPKMQRDMHHCPVAPNGEGFRVTVREPLPHASIPNAAKYPNVASSDQPDNCNTDAYPNAPCSRVAMEKYLT